MGHWCQSVGSLGSRARPARPAGLMALACSCPLHLAGPDRGPPRGWPAPPRAAVTSAGQDGAAMPGEGSRYRRDIARRAAPGQVSGKGRGQANTTTHLRGWLATTAAAPAAVSWPRPSGDALFRGGGCWERERG